MAKYIALLTLHIDTGGDGRRAAECIAEDVRDWAKNWMGVTDAIYQLREVRDALPVAPDESPA